jgi:hypothetical protein
MYLHLLAGRAQDELLGFDKYCEKRSTLPHPYLAVTLDPSRLAATKAWNDLEDAALAQLRPHVLAALKKASYADDEEYTPAQFHARFISLVPKGSVGAGKELFRRWDIPQNNLNKRLWLDNVPTSYLTEILNEPAECLTNAQIKTEAGIRLRQIIPGPIVQNLIEVMAIDRIEPAVFKAEDSFTLGLKPHQLLSDHLTRHDRVRSGKKWTVALDYDDFNRLHSIATMKKFWLKLIRDAALTLAAPGSWNGVNYAGHVARCSEWLASSLDQMFVREVGTDGMYRIVFQGLWSGWRTTTFINNTCNYVYKHISKETVSRALAGPISFSEDKINGDDGDYAADEVTDALFFLRHVTNAALEAQASKQLLGQTDAEYLRIWYNHEGITGSLARAVSSFVSGDLQDPVIDAGPAYVVGSSSALNMMIRRGFDPGLAEDVRRVVLMHYAYIKATRIDGTQVVQPVDNYATLFIPPSQGGFGAQRLGNGYDRVFCSTRPLPSAAIDWELGELPHYGVQQMQNSIIGRLANKNIVIAHPARLRRDIMNVVNEGVDTGLSFATSNIPRLALAEHIVWMNRTQLKERPPVAVLSSQQQDYARTEIETYLGAPADIRAKLRIPSFKNISTDILNRVLGMGSITPSLLDDCLDAQTGLPITISEVMHRFGVSYSATDPDQVLIPLDVFELLAREKLRMPSPNGNLLPDDFLPLYDLGLLPIIRYFPSPSADHTVSVPYYTGLFESYDVWFCEYWTDTYAHKYKF